ncbi:hypothetical protein [Paenibacillus koleovorans]|uniref:hypothetical protein n=1 Tax=Paenibacillus koleovorans TaxID=121608 RepID=UPI000FD6D7A0|nr:hypothetical protein [Paenibacillus koleovorans]
MSKIAVQFRKSPRHRYKFERLRTCRRCGSFSTLWSEHCLTCRRKGTFLRLKDTVRIVNRRMRRVNIACIAILAATAIIFSRTLTELIASFTAGLLALPLYYWLARKYEADVEHFRLQKILLANSHAVRFGLDREFQEALHDISENRHKEGYEKLREISLLIDNNSIRQHKLSSMRNFILRRDMELELASLLPAGFDEGFAVYMLDVCKLQPDLVNRQVVDYVLRHKDQIQSLDRGKELLVHVAAAVLLVKGYLKPYNGFVLEFTADLHRDSLLRLCKLLSPQAETYPELTARAKQAVKLKYEYDPEFQGLL